MARWPDDTIRGHGTIKEMYLMRNSMDSSKKKNEAGMALVTALLSLLVLMTLSTGIIFVTQSGMWTSVSYRALSQARFEAEAGAQDALRWFKYSYTPAAGAGYDTTKNPVEWGGAGQKVILSGIDGINSNYPTTTVQDDFYAAFHN